MRARARARARAGRDYLIWIGLDRFELAIVRLALEQLDLQASKGSGEEAVARHILGKFPKQ